MGCMGCVDVRPCGGECPWGLRGGAARVQHGVGPGGSTGLALVAAQVQHEVGPGVSTKVYKPVDTGAECQVPVPP